MQCNAVLNVFTHEYEKIIEDYRNNSWVLTFALSLMTCKGFRQPNTSTINPHI